MKTNRILSLCMGCWSFFMLYTSCSPEESEDVLAESSTHTLMKPVAKASACATELIPDQLVVKYPRGTSNRQKRTIRAKYKVAKVKRCPCADKTLELWSFDTGQDQHPIDIEEKKAVAETDPDLEGVDHNFKLSTTGTASYYAQGTGVPLSTNTISNNQGVGIAVLDTGLQFDHVGFQGAPFLYNSISNATSCTVGQHVEISGWDFVNQDAIADDANGHGTIVTQLITKTLQHLGVQHYILPVKIFDKKGEGTYFDLLCGYRFAVKKPGIAIVNMSFGWCGKPYAMLQDFIEETEKKGNILLVTSAGNEGNNNDQIPHFPSSYPHTNIISIAAMNSRMTQLASFSNYGKQSVDFAATGEGIVFDVGNGAQKVSGTSFATAYSTANAAKFYALGVDIKDIEAHMKAAATTLNSLYKIKHAAYIVD